MVWQYNNDMTNLGWNLMLNQLGGPFAWTSSWGNGVQFNMNSIMNMSPWQAYNFQAINGMVNFGIPINPFSACTMNFQAIDSQVNVSMNQRVLGKAETALKTLDATKESLEKMLTQEGVTDAQKATIREQIRKINELQAKIERMKPEMQTDKDWLKVYDAFEALMGEKTEIDTKIKELIDEVAEQNKAEDDDAVGEDDKVGGDSRVDDDSDNDSDTDTDPDGGANPDVAAALTAQATTKEEAQQNLSQVYGENAEPTGVTVTDDGKFSLQVTNKNGEQVTKEYSTVEEMQNAAAARHPMSKADAERDLEIVFGSDKAESGISVKENKASDGKVTSVKYVYKNNEYSTISEVLDVKKKEEEDQQKLEQEQAAAAAEQERLSQYDASDAQVDEIAENFKAAVNYGWIAGTDDPLFEKTVARLNAINVVEVMDKYLEKTEGEESFIDAFNWDADRKQRYTVGNYIYKALLERYTGKPITEIFENFPSPELKEGDEVAKYKKLDPDEFQLQNPNNDPVIAAFNELMKESNASVYTDNSDVKEAVETILNAIKANEKAK